MSVDRKYLNIIEDIIIDGQDVEARNSKTRKVFHVTTTYKSTPLVSVRRTAWRSALREMEWFLSGSNYLHDLHESVIPWWQPWVNKQGRVPNNYSRQFRDFRGHNNSLDQVDYLVRSLQTNPNSRRHVITTWNTADMVDKTTPITNCHGTVVQANVNNDRTLDLVMYQRSADVMLGVPHNMIQYWAFLLYLCSRTSLKPGRFIHTLGDAHIYEAHHEMAHKFMKIPVSNIETPELVYNPTSKKFKADDFSLEGEYNPIIKESLELIV